MDQADNNIQTPPRPGWIRVKFLKIHWKFAYREGDVTFLSPEKAKMLAEVVDSNGKFIDPYVEILPGDWTEPPAEKKLAIPESEYIPVVWREFHPKYAYKPGDKGIVHPDKIMGLIEGGFVQVDKKSNSNILKKIKSFTKNQQQQWKGDI